MSVVLCLPAHLRVSTAVSRGRPPPGTRQKRFTAAGLPSPRVPLGATNPEQRGAARSSQRSAAARSATQRQRRVRHGASSAVQSIALTAKEGPYQDRPPLCPFRLSPLLTCSRSTIAFLKILKIQGPNPKI